MRLALVFGAGILVGATWATLFLVWLNGRHG